MKLHAFLAAALCAGAAFTSHAALVTWSTPQTISGDSDVVTTGTLWEAVSFGPGAVTGTTINGVSFVGFANALGNATTTALPLSSDYLGLLNNGLLLPADTPFPLGFGSLTVGETYLFQVWVNNSGRNFSAFSRGDFPTTVSDALGNDVSLYPGDNGIGTGPADSNLPPVLGQYVIGTFTADADFQDFFFSSAEIPGVLNGFQLRQLAPAVPEPGTMLAGLVLAGLCGTMRRRQGSGADREA